MFCTLIKYMCQLASPFIFSVLKMNLHVFGEKLDVLLQGPTYIYLQIKGEGKKTYRTFLFIRLNPPSYDLVYPSILCKFFFLNTSFPDLRHISITINSFICYLIFALVFVLPVKKYLHNISGNLKMMVKKMSRCKSARKN